MSTTLLAIRPDMDTTIASLREEVGSETNPGLDVDLDRIHVNADDSVPTIALGETEVRFTDRGALALADALQVPKPFIKRIGDRGGITAQAELLNMALNYTSGGVVHAEYMEEGGLLEVRDPGTVRIRPGQLLSVAERVLGSPDSPIQRLTDTDSEFSFDVHVPYDHDRGVGGDRDTTFDLSQVVVGEGDTPAGLENYSWTSRVPIGEDSRVGDLTAAGLRFTIDRARGLTPSVQPWAMRLVCTNGMETTTSETKIDGRGLSVEEVLADLEVKAELAFSRLEREMVHFYDLRNQRVSNPERRLRAIARERGIPDRSLNLLMDAAPRLLGDETTEFDLVNMVTNLANHSSIRNVGGRMLLERAGGAVVNDHALRCTTCHSALIS